MGNYSYEFRTGDIDMASEKTFAGDFEPIIVLTGNSAEYEDFLKCSGRERESAVAVTTPVQFHFYPELRVCHYGTYWLNPAYESVQYNDRIRQMLLDKVGFGEDE